MKKTTLLALLLALCMILGLFAGCAKTEEAAPAAQEAAAEEAPAAEAEKAPAAESTYTELLNLRIASGDWPDIWGRSCGTTYAMDMDQAVADEVVLDIADLVPTYAPDWWAVI